MPPQTLAGCTGGMAVAVTLLWNRLQRLRLLRVQTNNGGAEATAKHVV